MGRGLDTRKETLRVAILDDDVLVARLLESMLEGAGYRAEALAPSSPLTIRRSLAAFRPDILLLDFDLGPESGSGLQYVSNAIETGTKVIGLTSSEDDLEHARYLEAGALGVLLKRQSPTDVVAAIELAATGHDVVGSAQRHELRSRLRVHREQRHRVRARFAQLTPREQQALDAMYAGRSAAQTAAEWVVSLPTVRSHIQSVLVKLGVNSQLEAVALARECGWPEIINCDDDPN